MHTRRPIAVAVVVVVALVAVLAVGGAARAQDADPFGDDAAVEAVPVLTDLSPRDTLVLRGDDLVRRGFQTLGEALAYVAGFSRERTSRGWRYALRGVPAGVLLVVDDVPQVVDGERDVIDVDQIVSLHDVDRVEIVRGPVTALHGAGALVGVVRITTKQPGLTGGAVRTQGSWLAGKEPQPGAEELSASGTWRAGDAGLRVSARAFGGKPELWRLHAAPTRYEVVGGADNHAVILPVKKEDTDVAVDDDAVNLAAVAQWGDATLSASAAHTTERSPLSAFSHGFVPDDPQTITRDVARAHLAWQRWLGPVHAAATAWLAGYRRSDDGPLYPRQGIFVDGGAFDVAEQAGTAGVVARVDVPITRDQRLVAGAFADGTVLHAQSSSRDPRTGKPQEQGVTLDDDTGTGAAALEWQGDFGAGLHATAGIAAEARTAFPLALAPRAALSWSPVDAVSLRASYSEGTRAPDRYDVTALAQTVVDGRAAGAGANPDLRPEHVRVLELSSSFQPSPRLSLDVRAYGMRHEDALTAVVSKRALLVPENLAPRLAVGGEATGSVQPFSDLVTLEGALAVSRTVDGPSLGEDFAQALFAVRAGPVEGVSVGVRGRALVRAAGESALADVWAAWFPAGDALGVTVAVDNVLDGNELSVDASAPPQADPILLPSPGRTLLLGVEGHL